MKRYGLLAIFIVCYLITVAPFTSYMKNKPVIEKLGYVPESAVLKLLTADQYHFVATSLMMNVLSYFGSIVEQTQNKITIPPEYPAMQNAIEAAVRLDPYNMDAYYFSQAIMVWDARQVRATNQLLEYGMKFRTWDWYLPYFAGFNYAYFLKDYENAARCYKKVGELTGNDLTINLAGRYLYESGRTAQAIAYLSLMIKSAANDAVKTTLQTRLNALQEIRTIEEAEERYLKTNHRFPLTVEDLMKQGYLAKLPIDPYGGKYYIDAQGKVRTTSKLAFGHLKNKSKN